MPFLPGRRLARKVLGRGQMGGPAGGGRVRKKSGGRKARRRKKERVLGAQG